MMVLSVISLGMYFSSFIFSYFFDLRFSLRVCVFYVVLISRSL